jgi:AsmA family protein
VRRAIIAIGFAAALLLAVAAFLFTNDDWLRAQVENEVASVTGRTLKIAGDFRVDWSLTPRVHAEQVKLDNALWGSHPVMLEVERAEFTLSVIDLLRGELVFPEVSLAKPRVLLEFSADGKRNWIFEREQERSDGDAPRIGRLSVDSGTLHYRNPAAQTDVVLAVATLASAPEHARTQIEAKGVFRGMKTHASGAGGPVLSLRDETLPYPLVINAQIDATRASVRGEVTGLVSLSNVNLDIKLQGPGLRELGKIIEISLPESAKYWVSGNLTRERETWRFVAFKGALGKSDVAGEFLFERGGERPLIRAALESEQLVLDELPLSRKDWGARPLALQRLRNFDADITLKAKSIHRDERALGNLSAQFKLNHGELKLDPLKFELGGGKVDATASLDARAEPPQSNASVTVSQLRLEKVFKKTSGTAAGNAKIKSSGGSFEEIVANSNGGVSFVVSDGEISGLLVSYAGLNAMGLFAALTGDRSRVPVNCAVGDFALKSGVMHTEVLVIDTTKTDIAGTGTIDLVKSAWNLTFSPLKEEEGIFSGLFSDGAPVRVSGTFKHPKFSADSSGVAARVGASAVLGIINPLAALIPLLPSGPETAANCAKLVEESRKREVRRAN